MSVDVLDAGYFAAIDPIMAGDKKRNVPGLNEMEASLRAPELKRDAARAAFMAGEVDDPDLSPVVNEDALEASTTSLYGLRATIEEEADPVVVEAYTGRIDEMLANASMLLGAARGNAELFLNGNVERFGEPDVDVFRRSLSVARKYAQRADSAIGDRFLDSTLDVGDISPPQTAEEFETVQKLFDPVVAEIAELLGDVPASQTGRELMPALQKVIDHFGFGYRVEPQAAGLSGMAVKHADTVVLVPEHKIYDDPFYVLGLTLHEIWIHVNEAIQGRQQPLRLVMRGLDRCLIAGEGKGLVSEQVIYPTYDDFMKTPRALTIVRRNLAIGAARGLLTGELMNFREVYESVNILDQAVAGGKYADKDEALSKAHDETWELLATRTQKGVTGTGMASFQDMVYAEGSGQQMQLLAHNPQVFDHLNKGKYNLLNPGHRRILEAVGIIPTGLITSK